MSLHWTDELALGHDLIDAQHQQLFARFEAFIAACDQRRGLGELHELHGFLDNYVQSHFAIEEELMLQHNYPHCERHLQEHRHFVARISGLRQELTQSGETVRVLVLTSKALVYWLTEHIRHVDRELAAFLHTG